MSTLVANSVFGVGRAAKQHARARWADDLWAPAGAQQFVRAPTAISKHPAARWLSLVTVEKPVIEEPPPKESARLSRIGDRHPGRHDRLRPGVEGHDHYRTALVTYGTITQSIGMAGNLTPANEADLNFASAGTVQNLYAQVGQTVIAGATLATLDTSLLSAQLQQARATLDGANAKLSQDRAGPTTQSLTSAENSVGSAQLSMNNAQTSLADTQAINAQAVAAAQLPVTAAQSKLTADQASLKSLLDADAAQLTVDKAAMTADCAGSPPC